MNRAHDVGCPALRGHARTCMCMPPDVIVQFPRGIRDPKTRKEIELVLSVIACEVGKGEHVQPSRITFWNDRRLIEKGTL